MQLRAVCLADIEALTGTLPAKAARWLGHRTAALLAEAHAAVDAAGDLAPRVHGRLSAHALIIDATGEVSILPREECPEPDPPIDGGRLTPRSDVLGLGLLLRRLLSADDDEELARALATAIEPHVARRRITCVELEAFLARGADLAAGREALAALPREVVAERARRDTTRPLSPPARVGVALASATLVYAAGVALVEHWPR